MIHCAPLSMEFLVRTVPLPSPGKWFPNFAVFRKLVLPSPYTVHLDWSRWDSLKSLFTHVRYLFTAPGTRLPTFCFLTLSSVFACCGQDTVVQPSSRWRRAEDKLHFDFRNLFTLALYHAGGRGKVAFLCLPFFEFLMAELSAGLVAASSAKSSWAARLVRAGAHL